MSEELQEAVDQYEEGLITAAEALVKIVSTVRDRLNADPLLGAISQIAVSMMKEQLADRTHHYLLLDSDKQPVKYVDRQDRLILSKPSTLMLKLTHEQADKLNGCLRDAFSLESKMADHINNQD